MLNPTRKALQPTNVKNLDLRIFSNFGKKIGLWYGKMLSYINWFVSGGKKQEYSETLRDDSNHTIKFKDNSEEVFIKSTDVDYLATDSDTLINKAPIQIIAGNDNPYDYILQSFYTGKVVVNYIYQGVPHTMQYENSDIPTIFADEGTEVALFGDISHLSITSGKRVKCYHSTLKELYIQELSDGEHYAETVELIGNEQMEEFRATHCSLLHEIRFLGNTALTIINFIDCKAIQTIIIEDCPNVEQLDLSGCTDIQELNVRTCDNLQRLNITKCTGLKKLNISWNANLTNLYHDENTAITEIIMHANNYQVTNDVASIIGEQIYTKGTIYIGKEDTYRSIIENAVINLSIWSVKYL